MVLALEEALTNIYEHGYNFPKSVDCPVTVEIFEGISTVYVIIVDKAKPFSLQSCKSINTSTYVDSKIIGGFGVTIIKKMMDEVVLFPLFDENVLIMTKDVRYSI
jgi:anti-sigma regulatory factor (Ser/Thr protein kinase)